MPEALKAVIAYLFEEVGLNRVAACHDVNNPKSGRVMQKAGMTKEGVLRFARQEDLERVNELRKEVNELHVNICKKVNAACKE